MAVTPILLLRIVSIKWLRFFEREQITYRFFIREQIIWEAIHLLLAEDYHVKILSKNE